MKLFQALVAAAVCCSAALAEPVGFLNPIEAPDYYDWNILTPSPSGDHYGPTVLDITLPRDLQPASRDPEDGRHLWQRTVVLGSSSWTGYVVGKFGTQFTMNVTWDTDYSQLVPYNAKFVALPEGTEIGPASGFDSVPYGVSGQSCHPFQGGPLSGNSFGTSSSIVGYIGCTLPESHPGLNGYIGVRFQMGTEPTAPYHYGWIYTLGAGGVTSDWGHMVVTAWGYETEPETPILAGAGLLSPCSPADLNGDGVLDNGDIGDFVSLYLAGDLAVDFNSDGILDNGDIGAFVATYLAGC